MINGMAVCAGIGGLELGLERALVGYRSVCYIERDAYAASVLVARMEEKALGPAPVFDSIESFDGVPWRGAVDILSAGFPCQPWSSAGRRQGTKDHRWLWPHILRVITECRPAAVFLENSPGLDVEGVRRTLLEVGYGSEAVEAAISDRKRRRRVFILAYADSIGQQGERGGGVRDHLRASLRDDADRRDPGASPAAVLPRSEPRVRRGSAPTSNRVERLRALGNAVCPPQAEAALRWLLQTR